MLSNHHGETEHTGHGEWTSFVMPPHDSLQGWKVGVGRYLDFLPGMFDHSLLLKRFLPLASSMDLHAWLLVPPQPPHGGELRLGARMSRMCCHIYTESLSSLFHTCQFLQFCLLQKRLFLFVTSRLK